MASFWKAALILGLCLSGVLAAPKRGPSPKYKKGFYRIISSDQYDIKSDDRNSRSKEIHRRPGNNQWTKYLLLEQTTFDATPGGRDNKISFQTPAFPQRYRLVGLDAAGENKKLATTSNKHSAKRNKELERSLYIQLPINILPALGGIATSAAEAAIAAAPGALESLGVNTVLDELVASGGPEVSTLVNALQPALLASLNALQANL